MINYFDLFSSHVPREILADESRLELRKTVSLFKDFASRAYGLETCLDNDEQRADFAFSIKAAERETLARGFKGLYFQPLAEDKVWDRVISFVNSWSTKNTGLHKNIDNIWFEMDSGEYGKDIPRPCFFFDASKAKNDSAVISDWLFAGALKKLLDSQLTGLLQDKIKTVIKCLPPGAGLSQVGTMLARNEDGVRICTSELTMEQTAGYLNSIGWPGDFSEFSALLDIINIYSNGKYRANFDVTSNGVSEKMGIEFRVSNSQVLPVFLNELVRYNFCTKLKKRGILSWKGSSCHFMGPDYGQTSLIRTIAHFKISYLPGAEISIKAYLLASGVYLKELFKLA
jgi:hypothetical protein